MKIIVMLIIIGTAHGGPTTIQGFESLSSCKNQISIVSKAYECRESDEWVAKKSCEFKCLELEK